MKIMRSAEDLSLLTPMEYLEKTGLERKVSRALLDTINAREANSVHAFVHKLLGMEGVRRDELIQTVEDERAARRSAELEVLRLQEAGHRREEELRKLQDDVQRLQLENEDLQAKTDVLKANASQLESWVRGMEPVRSGADRVRLQPTPMEAGNGPSAPAAASLIFVDTLGRVFDKIAVHGQLESARLDALCQVLEKGCAASTNLSEATAMRQFLMVLRRMRADGAQTPWPLTKNLWLSHMPSDGDLAPNQRETVRALLDAIMKNGAAAEGFCRAINHIGTANLQASFSKPLHPTWAQVMQGLYDSVMQGDCSRVRLKALIASLKAGCETPEADPRERSGVTAFLHVLLKLSNDQPRYTRSEWMGLAPLPGSFAAEDREAAVQMLWAILQNEDAVEGLRGMMEQYAHEGGA